MFKYDSVCSIRLTVLLSESEINEELVTIKVLFRNECDTSHLLEDKTEGKVSQSPREQLV